MASLLGLAVSSPRPETIIVRNRSPRTCTARSNRFASSSETVDLPEAIGPVTTNTFPFIPARLAEPVLGRHPWDVIRRGGYCHQKV
jgi:hypothetical protein